MLESKAPIIPVFYNVTPADLRWTQGKDGVYTDALRNLEKKTTHDSESQEEKPRYSSNTIENWRKALATVSEISGFELAAFDGDEGVLLEKLVELLLKKVKKKEKEVYVADYPTGLEEKVKDFESFLSKLPENRPKVAAIVGLGGIGKTTLAKELFNRKRPNYRRTCFLSAVRDTAKSGGGSLVALQKKLLRSLFGNDYQIDSIDIGKQQLMSCFRSFSHGMLILDDVDHLDQLDALLPGADKYTFPSNCLILITSRNKCVLASSGIQPESIYQLTGLNTHHSRELFCRYAFCQPHPLPCFQYFVDSILKICAGLPLSLKVIGSHFCGNTDKTYWEAELTRINGHPDIQQILKISFDSLDEEEKQLFLYISCFLIREKMDTAMKVWDQSGCKGFSVFQNLRHKSLVEVDGENFIHMHDHLRELGRRIAENSGFRIPCLWDRTENSEDIANLLLMLKHSSNHNVRGISMIPSANQEPKSYAPLRSNMTWFKRTTHELLRNPVMKLCNRRHKTLDNLELLITEDQLLESILKTVALPNLRWLRWYKCGHYSLPSWIPKENLRVLYVAGKALRILWRCKAQAPLQLRELKILAPLSKLPKSIGQLKHLEEIYIWLPDANFMTSLPDEFCQLPSLKRFELINAWRMELLPDSFGNLVTLEHLNLSCSCSLRRLPNSFEKLSRLKYLDLRGSDSLIISTTTHKSATRARRRERHVQEWYKRETEKEDQWVESEHRVVLRDMWDRRRQKGRPAEIDEWVEFEEWVELEERVWSDKWMDRQWRRRFDFCWVLGVFLRWVIIFILGATLMIFSSALLPWLACLAWLAWLTLALTFVATLRRVKTLRRMPSKRTWEAWRAEREWVERKWAVRECPRMRETSDSASLTHFRQALLAEEMNQLMPLQLPPSLQELHIKELPGTFENLCNLEVLELNGSFSKMLPPSLSVLSNLKELRLVNCPRLKSLPDSLGLLSVLEVKCCPGLVDVRTLPTTLIQLSLISCPKLKKIDLGLFGLAELQTLNLSGWTEVEELAGIETLVSLEELRASGCENLKRIHSVS